MRDSGAGSWAGIDLALLALHAMMPVTASFRDPGGFCFTAKERVLRFVDAGSTSCLQRFLDSASAKAFISDRAVIPTRRLDSSERERLMEDLPEGPAIPTGGVVFEHERVFFPTYPYEWAPEMLAAAGELTLEIARKILQDGFILKDATPYNVLFRGANPVFIDLLSFEARDAGDPVWLPYAQFVRTFLLPLLARKYWDARMIDIFLTHRDGLEPEEVYEMCGVFRRLRPPFLNLVSLPVWMGGKSRNQALYAKPRTMQPEKATFVLEMLFNRLRRSLRSLQPGLCRGSAWAGYMQDHSYSEQSFRAKERFVEDALTMFAPKRILDVGANTGHFSVLAARKGASIVAIDSDAACVGALWRRARAEQLDILPMVVDFSRPTPAIGWRNAECPSFIDRATQSFDCVLMLAVLHHLLVSERIPLDEVLKLAGQLTSRLLIIEYVDPADEMFRTLSRGRGRLFEYLTPHYFEAGASQYFNILNSADLAGSHRRLYILQRKCAPGVTDPGDRVLPQERVTV